MKHAGSCHCGAVRISFETRWNAEAAPVRACACRFCRSHGARVVTDPNGRLTLFYDIDAVHAYRFGLKTADFLICKTCGLYVAAVAETPQGLRATLNINLLDAAGSFNMNPDPVSYEGESAQERLSRRGRNWTPVKMLPLSAQA